MIFFFFFFFYLYKIEHTAHSCVPDEVSNLGPLDLESDAVPTGPPRHPILSSSRCTLTIEEVLGLVAPLTAIASVSLPRKQGGDKRGRRAIG